MKTLKTHLFFLLIGLFIFNITSCNKDDDGGDGGTAAPGTVQAKIDGSTFTSNSMASQANIVDVGPSFTINILGTDLSGNNINLTLNGVTGPGTYVIGGDNLVSISASYTEINTSTFQSSTWQAPYEGGDEVGEINIAQLEEDNIVGTFNFTARNSDDGSFKEVTDGSFNMAF